MAIGSIFISSVQKELEAERRALKDFIESDILLRHFFTFLWEDLPAADHRADGFYIESIDRCTVYIGLFGNEYGFEDGEGIYLTEREFDRATSQGKARLIFLKGTDDKKRHPKMQALISKAERQLIRRRFTDISDLIPNVYASLVQYMEQAGQLATTPLDPTVPVIPRRIFVSYAREDFDQVEPLYEALKKRGHKPWMDKKDMLAGQQWEARIRSEIEGSDFFIACISKKSITKRGFVQKEIRFALEVLSTIPQEQIYLIPVRLEKCKIPQQLKAYNCVDLDSKGTLDLIFKTLEVEQSDIQ